MNVDAVEDTLKTLMAHSLKVNPTKPSWLRTQADIFFGECAVCTRLDECSVCTRLGECAVCTRLDECSVCTRLVSVLFVQA